jgi:hypothetical protein
LNREDDSIHECAHSDSRDRSRWSSREKKCEAPDFTRKTNRLLQRKAFGIHHIAAQQMIGVQPTLNAKVSRWKKRESCVLKAASRGKLVGSRENTISRVHSREPKHIDRTVSNTPRSPRDRTFHSPVGGDSSPISRKSSKILCRSILRHKQNGNAFGISSFRISVDSVTSHVTTMEEMDIFNESKELSGFR